MLWLVINSVGHKTSAESAIVEIGNPITSAISMRQWAAEITDGKTIK